MEAGIRASLTTSPPATAAWLIYRKSPSQVVKIDRCRFYPRIGARKAQPPLVKAMIGMAQELDTK